MGNPNTTDAMRHTGFLACAILACSAYASTPLPITSVKDSPEFATLNEAATAALKIALRKGRQFEYGGALLKCGDTFVYTEPVTSRELTNVSYAIVYDKARCTLEGIYHTHPNLHHASDQFSKADIETQQKLGVPSYIGTVAARAVLKLDKGKAQYVGQATD